MLSLDDEGVTANKPQDLANDIASLTDKVIEMITQGSPSAQVVNQEKGTASFCRFTYGSRIHITGTSPLHSGGHPIALVVIEQIKELNQELNVDFHLTIVPKLSRSGSGIQHDVGD